MLTKILLLTLQSQVCVFTIDENKAGNQLLELVKAGKLGNFTDVSSAINAMKQQLQDDDQEIPTTKKRK